jgi:hypothetical protein
MRAWLMVALAIATLALMGSAQDLRDFTRSPTEHIINELETPISVRAVAGLVVLKGGGDPLPNIILELRGPGKNRRIRRVTTDEHGRLAMRNIPGGVYRFKTTLNGFQSVVGTIVVSKSAPVGEEIRIETPFGV